MQLNFLAKYGTLLTIAVLMLIGALTWFIKYPEIVNSSAKLTGTNAPKPVYAKQSARLLMVQYENGDEIKEGSLIGAIETTASVEEVLRFSDFVDSLLLYLEFNDRAKIKEMMQGSFKNLGELQGEYQQFMQTYIAYRDMVLGDYVSSKKQLLTKDIQLNQISRQILQDQDRLNTEDLAISNQNMERNKRLLEEQLISEQEYFDLMSQNINKQQVGPQSRANFASNDLQYNSIRKELLELDNQVALQQANFQQAVFQLKNQISSWKMNYLLIAPISGKIAFTSFWQANHLLQAGEAICYIIPDNSEIYVETSIPQSNFGRVEEHQKVLLKFDAFPWQEYGLLLGEVAYISPVPSDSGSYLTRIILPDGLLTNYNKEIPFIEGLEAQSEIITKDMRLAENLYYSVVKEFKK